MVGLTKEGKTMMVVTHEMGFAKKVADRHLAEAARHHPKLAVSYDRVTVKLSTQSTKGITDLDFVLAAKIEDVGGLAPGRIVQQDADRSTPRLHQIRQSIAASQPCVCCYVPCYGCRFM
jgi:hypothetical protein